MRKLPIVPSDSLIAELRGDSVRFQGVCPMVKSKVVSTCAVVALGWPAHRHHSPIRAVPPVTRARPLYQKRAESDAKLRGYRGKLGTSGARGLKGGADQSGFGLQGDTEGG